MSLSSTAAPRSETVAHTWRRGGIGRSPARRERFLREIRHGARVGFLKALRDATSQFPERSMKELYDELVSELLIHFTEQARVAGLDDEETADFVDAYRAAFEAVGRAYGLI
jgi:hypothetical protein